MQSRFNYMNNGSPAEAKLRAPAPDVGRSAFDYSFIHNGNTMPGIVAPVGCFDVVPGEDIDISLAALLEFRNPSKRQLYNGFRVYFHAYYNRLVDLWEGARNWIDNGRSGKIQLTRPNAIYFAQYNVEGETNPRKCNSNTPMSLLNFLGLPVEYIQKKCKASDGTLRSPIRQFQCSFEEDNSPHSYTRTKVGEPVDFFPADCLMAYQRNWRDFYSNKNLLQNNKYWFPDNEDHFILSYDCENACAILYENEDFKKNIEGEEVDENSQHGFQYANLVGSNYTGNSVTPEPNNPVTNADTYTYINAPNLCGIKFRQFRGDRFTTASPFPDLIRGDIPFLNITADNLTIPSLLLERTGDTLPNSPVYLTTADENHDPHYTSTKIKFNPRPADDINVDSPPTSSGLLNNDVLFQGGDQGVLEGQYLAPYAQATDIHGFYKTVQTSVPMPVGTSVTMSDIYTLETLTAFRRKMGMTNGDYNETIKAQFGVNPNFHDRKGVYIGGFYQDFALSSVTQQSQTDSSPLGTKSGQGVSSGAGRIGHFSVNDFGWIQIYMSIVPDVYYTQGKPRMFSKKSNLELYFPLFNNLPAQAVRNDELFISNNSTVNGQPFNYEDRYAEYKSNHNRVSGFMGLPVANAEYDTARVMARRFSSTPSFNSLFVTLVPENIDMSVFFIDDEPPFDFSVAFNIRRVSPMPYVAIEGSLSSPRLNA